MNFKPIGVSLGTSCFCLACGGTGKLRAKRKAKQLNGPDIDYDEVKIPCPACGGTGISKSTDTAPRSRRIE